MPVLTVANQTREYYIRSLSARVVLCVRKGMCVLGIVSPENKNRTNQQKCQQYTYAADSLVAEGRRRP